MYLLLFLVLYFVLLKKLTIGCFYERYEFVTGCDSGFGNMLAKQLDLLGFWVFACCLNNSGVKSLTSECSVNVTAIQMDVTSDDSIEQAMELVRENIPKDKVTKGFRDFTNKVTLPNVSDVVDAYIDAIVTKFPKKR